jgi:hypothetical protein
VGGEQLAGAAELVGLLEQADVGAGRWDACRRGARLQVDGLFATGLGTGDDVAIAVTKTAELPKELVDQADHAQ